MAPVSAAGLPSWEFPWSEAVEAAGLERGAFYLVRPDGYLAYAGTDMGALRAHAARFKIAART